VKGAAMQHNLVPDGDIVTHRAGKAARIKGPIVGYVQNRTILYAAAFANTNLMDVTPYNRQGPHRGILTELHITNNLCAIVNKCSCTQNRGILLKGSNCHENTSCGKSDVSTDCTAVLDGKRFLMTH